MEDLLWSIPGGTHNEIQAFLSKGAQVIIIRVRGLPCDIKVKSFNEPVRAPNLSMTLSLLWYNK